MWSEATSVNISNTDLSTSLHNAVKSNNTVELDTLLRLPEAIPDTWINGRTLLSWASTFGHAGSVKVLLEHKANTDAQEDRDGTKNSRLIAPLQLLSTATHHHDLFLSGNTALLLAVKAQRQAVVLALLAAKADTSIRNKQGLTALSTALQRETMEGTVEAILAVAPLEDREALLREAHGINYAKRGYNPLMIALEEGRREEDCCSEIIYML